MNDILNQYEIKKKDGTNKIHRYFVLDLDEGEDAEYALRAYAQRMKNKNPDLSRALLTLANEKYERFILLCPSGLEQNVEGLKYSKIISSFPGAVIVETFRSVLNKFLKENPSVILVNKTFYLMEG